MNDLRPDPERDYPVTIDSDRDIERATDRELLRVFGRGIAGLVGLVIIGLFVWWFGGVFDGMDRSTLNWLFAGMVGFFAGAFFGAWAARRDERKLLGLPPRLSRAERDERRRRARAEQ